MRPTTVTFIPKKGTCAWICPLRFIGWIIWGKKKENVWETYNFVSCTFVPRYAAQMRQSAVYLHQTPQHYQQQRNQSLSRVTMQPKLPGIRDKTDESRISIMPDSTCPALRRTQRDHVHGQHTMPAQPLTQRHSEWVMQYIIRISN